MTQKMIDRLIEMGASEWEKGANHRLYLNGAGEKLVGLTYTTYNSGQVSSARLDGETTTNANANRIMQVVNAAYYDMVTGEWVIAKPRGVKKYDYDKISEMLEEKIEAMTAETDAEQTEQTEQTAKEETEMKRKYEIWFLEDRAETGMLIPTDEIEQKIATFGDAAVYRLDEAATDERIAGLMELLKVYAQENDFHWSRLSDVEDFFEEHGIEYQAHGDDYYLPDGKIVFCQGKFWNEDVFDTFAVYSWWDGSNWKYVERPEPHEDGYVEELEYDEQDEECLDEWDGSNYTSGSTGRHDYVVRLGENRNLMIYRSQWEGEHTGAQIMTDAEYAEYRNDRGLDE